MINILMLQQMLKFADIILIIKQFYYFIFTLQLKHSIVDKVIYQWHWQPGFRHAYPYQWIAL